MGGPVRWRRAEVRAGTTGEPGRALERTVQGSAPEEDSVMIEQGNAAKAERGGGGGAGGTPLPSRFSPEMPSQQTFRGLVINVLDAELCVAVPSPVLDQEPSRLRGVAAQEREQSHCQDGKPTARRYTACAGQGHALATAQPTTTCLVHNLIRCSGLHRTKKSSRRVTFLRATLPASDVPGTRVAEAA